MKILWVCNIMPPVVGQYLNQECSVKEGWISGILSRLAKEEDGPQIAICYPVDSTEKEQKQRVIIENKKEVTCYGFYENTVSPHLYGGEALERRLEEIIKDCEPDVLHIFGTEYGHCLAAVKAFQNPEHTLIGLQGIIGECAKEYMADLPQNVQNSISFRDWLKKDSLRQQQEKFFIRGQREKEALQLTGNVTGRTHFDKEAATAMNPNVTYFFMNETMRQEFYQGTWDGNTCQKHRIFVSQADYPLKGFHYLLQALQILVKTYPDVTVAVAGNSLVNHKSLKDTIKRSAYGNYLLKEMKKAGLEDRITFLGKLSAKQMKEQYLQCHTFVCPSSLENSPNSVGEAMLIGTPVVASNTGGIPSLLTHEKEGLLFEKGNVNDLANAIMKTWEDGREVDIMSKNARARARKTHDADKNYRTLLEIYRSVQK